MSINELYMIYKSRKNFLKKLYEDILNMEFFGEENRQDILLALEEEMVRVQNKINDLIW